MLPLSDKSSIAFTTSCAFANKLDPKPVRRTTIASRNCNPSPPRTSRRFTFLRLLDSKRASPRINNNPKKLSTRSFKAAPQNRLRSICAALKAGPGRRPAYNAQEPDYFKVKKYPALDHDFIPISKIPKINKLSYGSVFDEIHFHAA